MFNKISVMLDAIADKLESKGLIKEAFEIDRLADSVEAVADYDWEKDPQGIQDKLDRKFYGDPPVRNISPYEEEENARKLRREEEHYNQIQKEHREINIRIVKKIPKDGPVDPKDIEDKNYEDLVYNYLRSLDITITDKVKDTVEKSLIEFILTSNKANKKVVEELEELKKLKLVYQNFPEKLN